MLLWLEYLNNDDLDRSLRADLATIMSLYTYSVLVYSSTVYILRNKTVRVAQVLELFDYSRLIRLCRGKIVINVRTGHIEAH